MTLALASATIMSACASDQPPDTPSANTSLSETRSSGPSRWELVRWQRPDGTLRDIPHGDNGQPIIFDFNDGIDSPQGTVSGTSGCNRFTGGYGKTSTGIRFDRIAGTRMACPGRAWSSNRRCSRRWRRRSPRSARSRRQAPPGGRSSGRRPMVICCSSSSVKAWAGAVRRSMRHPARKIVYIDSQRVECSGVGKMQCYRWRESPDAPWQLWYGAIEGLDFEPGVSYKLRVREYQVPNPPADASSIRWQLLDVEERSRPK
jgi:heat shock protein HslJ